MAAPYLIMVNPKTLELCSMFTDGHRYRLAPFTSPVRCIGGAYTEESKSVAGGTYLRIHSPGGCGGRGDFSVPPAPPEGLPGVSGFAGVESGFKGKGYGLLLYAGTAVGVHLFNRRASGVFSIEGNRSDQAERLWEKLVDGDIADTEEVEDEEGEEQSEEEEHCFKIDDDDREVNDGGWITDREICGEVNVTRTVYEGTITVNYIDGENVLEQDFVVWAGKEQVEGPPGDLITRVHVENQEGAIQVAQFIRGHYEDERLLHAFLDRQDIAGLLGQMRLPLEGPFGQHRGRVPLPPVSRRTERLLDLFEGAE